MTIHARKHYPDKNVILNKPPWYACISSSLASLLSPLGDFLRRITVRDLWPAPSSAASPGPLLIFMEPVEYIMEGYDLLPVVINAPSPPQRPSVLYFFILYNCCVDVCKVFSPAPHLIGPVVVNVTQRTKGNFTFSFFFYSRRDGKRKTAVYLQTEISIRHTTRLG